MTLERSVMTLSHSVYMITIITLCTPSSTFGTSARAPDLTFGTNIGCVHIGCVH